MADNSGFIKIGLIGGIAYLAYSKGWLSSLGIGAPVPAGTTALTTVSPASPVPAAAAPASAIPSLDSLGSQVVTQSAGQSMGPDGFNAILTSIYPPAGPLPDPVGMFPGWSRPASMGFATYWAVVAPWLKQNKGLSGIGLHGLGFLYTGGM